MPLFYQHNINQTTKLGIWKIEEPLSFFLDKVPLQAAIHHPHKKLQHLAGRFLLQYLFPDFPYEELLVADTRKPYLPNEQYHFSISHCGNYAAAIVSSQMRVGIDIEIPTQKLYSISKKFLHTDEITGFGLNTNLADHEEAGFNLQQLTLLWCAKEAVYKWWGLGGVDFSEHMLLLPFNLAQKGVFGALFNHPQLQKALQANYTCFDEICLVWVCN
ncbi:4'-phosphopantetheinyl transferase family protein [Limnovirga soli]|uniref:4'-phosphopantetheinyl transferase superfamily protein n=1 Tax=Limnovirga soli TaxID=2656915 RepID=A0A8J8FF10_9BACT|nr:4'-phosphopantetheinyl transferase superfamily protein [Limnovirga soli]NNV56850.1 4'-phosphopantetheinyl transferase superfamily protein [Limnovirga soli]